MLGDLQTNRFLLRVPTLDDAATVTALVQDPRIYEKVARIPPRQTVEQSSRWILGVQRGNELGTDHTALILDQGRIIGAVGAHRQAVSEPFEIGYWITPDHWRRGIATETAGAVIAWLEASGKGRVLLSGHFIDNPGSGRVLAKLGFVATHTGPVFCLGRGREVEHVFLQRRQHDVV